ncbi:hypothetical protein C8Q75DRAFT_788542 [Abortiporus biennis]|nr:hypothetical protein C8Q75DRAFT_788542 [Abortiporus biennis]
MFPLIFFVDLFVVYLDGLSFPLSSSSSFLLYPSFSMFVYVIDDFFWISYDNIIFISLYVRLFIRSTLCWCCCMYSYYRSYTSLRLLSYMIYLAGCRA